MFRGWENSEKAYPDLKQNDLIVNNLPLFRTLGSLPELNVKSKLITLQSQWASFSPADEPSSQHIVTSCSLLSEEWSHLTFQFLVLLHLTLNVSFVTDRPLQYVN